MARKKLGQLGFSLLEILAILILLSFFSLFTIGRSRQGVSTALRPQAEAMIGHLRCAQTRAMNSDSLWGIHYDAENAKSRYWLFRNGDISDKIVLPGEIENEVNLEKADIAIAQGSFTLVFDTWGRPRATDLFFNGRKTTLTLFTTGGRRLEITIHENTGFVQWQQ